MPTLADAYKHNLEVERQARIKRQAECPHAKVQKMFDGRLSCPDCGMVEEPRMGAKFWRGFDAVFDGILGR